MNRLLILFVKYPEPGQVKTRLGKDIGFDQAAEIYKQLVSEQIENLRDPSSFDLALWVDPEHRIEAYRRIFGSDHTCRYQEGRDLGERMQKAFEEAFKLGYRQAVLVGSDVPLLDRNGIRSFFDHLSAHEMVIGPALDGGYYMIGFSSGARMAAVFQGIPWSMPEVFDTTMYRARNMGVKREKTWFDVDTTDDLERYRLLKAGHSTFSSADIT